MAVPLRLTAYLLLTATPCLSAPAPSSASSTPEQRNSALVGTLVNRSATPPHTPCIRIEQDAHSRPQLLPTTLCQRAGLNDLHAGASFSRPANSDLNRHHLTSDSLHSGDARLHAGERRHPTAARIPRSHPQAPAGRPCALSNLSAAQAHEAKLLQLLTTTHDLAVSRTLPPGLDAGYRHRILRLLRVGADTHDCSDRTGPRSEVERISNTLARLQKPHTSDPHVANAQAGYISGQVTGSGGPLPGVWVYIFDDAGNLDSVAYTDSSGFYISEPLLPGSRYARTENAAGYLNEVYDDVPCVFHCDLTAGTPITVTAGDTTTAINFSLEPGGAITGSITDAATGLPLANLDVHIFDANGGYVTHGTSDLSGNYRSAAGLHPGDYFARTDNYSRYIDEVYGGGTCSFSSCDPLTGTPIHVAATSTMSGIDFELEQGGAITGTITDGASTLPLEGISIYVYDQSGSLAAWGWTNAAGEYQNDKGLISGTYFVRTGNTSGYIDELWENMPCLATCWPPGGTPITVTTPSTTPDIDFTLEAGGTLSGILVDQATAAPIPDSSVHVFHSSGNFVTMASLGTSGSFAVLLPPGTYYARSFNEAGYLDELFADLPCALDTCNVTDGQTITVAANTITSGVDFALAPGGAITGTVSDEISGLAIGGGFVHIYDSDGNWVTWDQAQPSGYRSRRGLPSGNFRAVAQSFHGYRDELFAGIPCGTGCDVTTGTGIEVTAGATTSGIDIPLQPVGEIAGVVTDADTGAPLSGIMIHFYTAAGDFANYAVSAADGSFGTGMDIPIGDYRARTFNERGYFDELYDNVPCTPACDTSAGAPIIVSTGAPSSITFALVPGGAITGAITDATNGLPLLNVAVEVFDSEGNWITYGYSDANGYRTAQGLASGDYFVRAMNHAGFQNQLYNGLQCLGHCEVTHGTPVSVTSPQATAGIDFALTPGGRLSGTVIDAETDLPMAGVFIYVLDGSGYLVSYGYTDADGNYLTEFALPTGAYFAHSVNFAGYVDEIYPGVTCPFAGCTGASGSPIEVVNGAIIYNIDFALSRAGAISGKVTDAITGSPIPDVWIELFAASGDGITVGPSEANGDYASSFALPAGTYFARTFNTSSYLDELFEDKDCALSACTPSEGAPITVSSGATTTSIDFSLAPGGSVSGVAMDSDTDSPIHGLSVWIFDSAGEYQTSGATDWAGTYRTERGLPTGDYFARTASFTGYIDELYDNLSCRWGCTPTDGTSIRVVTGLTTSGVDFALTTEFFRAHFEAGGFGEWDSVSP
jgi:hypothetical protein